MKKIIISPYSKKLKNGKTNPKNYPYWKELVQLLIKDGYEVEQFDLPNEPPINGITKWKKALPIYKIHEILPEYDFFISVDNFFHHMCAYHNFKGYVLFSQSDPKIFGHDLHTNIYKDTKYFRLKQFEIWEQCEYNNDAFLSAKSVFDIIKNKENEKSEKR